MKKRIIDCTYKEIKTYYGNHFNDTQIGMLLGAFGKPFVRDEQSWHLRVKCDFPSIFKKSFLNRKIEIEEIL